MRTGSALQFVYRGASVIALVILFFALINTTYRASLGTPMIPIVPLLLAVAIWLFGYFCQYCAED